MSGQVTVVGAGSAGCVIAARLSESSHHEVLLLEAGPDYPDPSRLPDDLTDGGRNSMVRHDWGYRHQPNVANVRLRFPRGRVVGGSSAVNTCIALRGQPSDYDEWAQRGLEEWSWERCLPAFKRLERDLDFDNEWHGTEGELPIRRHPTDELCAWQAAFLEACDRLGYPPCPDTNAPNSRGAGPHAMNKLDGRRISAAEAFLHAGVRARSNLNLQAETLVRRVLFQGRKVRALEVQHAGAVQRLPTDRVVLCAGAIDTPGVLLRSGIGPRAELERLGVEPVVNLPAVGARVLDHPGTAIFLRPRLRAPTRRRDPLIQTVLRYASHGSDHASDMLLQPGSKVNLPRLDVPLVSLMCAVGKPKSRGRLFWPTAAPDARPRLESRLFVHREDRQKAVEAMQIAARLARTPPLARLARPLLPNARALGSAADIERWIERACDSGYHPSGTVPMGADGDPDAATDGRGRVRGVEGLWVADASLMPTIPSSNIHLATLMIGERLAEWLRGS